MDFSKLGMCIDVAESWFRMAYGQTLSIYRQRYPAATRNGGVFSFHVFSHSSYCPETKL